MAIGIYLDQTKIKKIYLDNALIKKVYLDNQLVWQLDNWVNKSGEIARRDIPVRDRWIPWPENSSGEAWLEVLNKKIVELSKPIRVKELYVHCDLIRTEPSPWNPNWIFSFKFRNADTGVWFEERLAADTPDLKYGFSQAVSAANQLIPVDAYEYNGSILSNPQSRHKTSGYLVVRQWQERES